MTSNTFSGAPLDRAGARRTDSRWVEERVADPASRALLITSGGVAVEGGRLARVPLATARAEAGAAARAEADAGGAPPILLGLDPDGAALFAVDVTEAGPRADEIGLREAAALLPHEEAGLVAQATALVNWHRRHPHCSVCGHMTELREAGYLRHCPNCGADHHPRTDPVVIMLVLDGDRALLGRQPRWPPGRYSALAGFVEPGESLEEAVAREVLEEAGVSVRGVRYASSQPWPFPSSLMLGFYADWAGGEPAPQDDDELEEVRWFAREELESIRAGTVEGMHLPPPIAIARTLIDGWLR